VAAARAAYLWYQSAKVRVEPTRHLEHRHTIDRAIMEWVTGAMTAFHQASRLNQHAVIWTAFAALLGAVSAVASTAAIMAQFL
jgi:hypothetical protein